MAAEIEGGPNVTPHVPEGTAIKSTGETGGTKFLREDGDGTSSWQAPSAHTPEGVAVVSTGVAAGKYLQADGDDTSSWQDMSPANYKITLDWGSSQTGVTYYATDGASNNFGTNVNVAEVTHGLGTRDVIVSVVDLNAGDAGGTNPGTSPTHAQWLANAEGTAGAGDNLNYNPYDGTDIGHSGHIVVNRYSDNVVRLVFGIYPTTGFEYRVLVIKVG